MNERKAVLVGGALDGTELLTYADVIEAFVDFAGPDHYRVELYVWSGDTVNGVDRFDYAGESTIPS